MNQRESLVPVPIAILAAFVWNFWLRLSLSAALLALEM